MSKLKNRKNSIKVDNVAHMKFSNPTNKLNLEKFGKYGKNLDQFRDENNPDANDLSENDDNKEIYVNLKSLISDSKY